MKKIMIITTFAIFFFAANAQKAFKKQVEIATEYAKQAQIRFDLSEEAQGKIFETKKAQFEESNKKIKPMKEANKSTEEIQTVQKEIGKAYSQKCASIVGCKVKEIYSFNKEFAKSMKAK